MSATKPPPGAELTRQCNEAHRAEDRAAYVWTQFPLTRSKAGLYCNGKAATARSVFGSETLLPHLAAFAATWGETGVPCAQLSPRHPGSGPTVATLPNAPWALVTPVRAGLQTRQRRRRCWGEVQRQQQRQRAVRCLCLRLVAMRCVAVASRRAPPSRGLPGKSKQAPAQGGRPQCHLSASASASTEGESRAEAMMSRQRAVCDSRVKCMLRLRCAGCARQGRRWWCAESHAAGLHGPAVDLW